MVSFAIAETSSLPLNSQPNDVISLRYNALWFPDIPESHLQLNETYFQSRDKAVSGFRPLCCYFRDAPILDLYWKSSRQRIIRKQSQLSSITALETYKDWVLRMICPGEEVPQSILLSVKLEYIRTILPLGKKEIRNAIRWVIIRAISDDSREAHA
jgi:hypothetical protein